MANELGKRKLQVCVDELVSTRLTTSMAMKNELIQRGFDLEKEIVMKTGPYGNMIIEQELDE